MIRCHFRSQESDSNEEFADVVAFIERMKKSLEASNEEVVLRVPDDETFFDVDLYRAATEAGALKQVQTIIGSSAPCWAQKICAPEGDGWRMWWSPVRANSQMQPQPQAQAQGNGKRR